MAVLPTVYQTGQWWERLWYLLSVYHPYGRAMNSLRRTASASQLLRHEGCQSVKAILEITQILTLIMVSFLVLAVLYDFQYPADDGTCKLYVDEGSCLSRRSLLDGSITYCEWVPDSIDHPDVVANMLVESRNGRFIQRIDLDDVDSETNVQCIFNASPSSILTTVLSIVLASIVSIPTDLFLTFLFAKIGVRSTKQVHDQILAGKMVISLRTHPFVHQSIVINGSQRRRNVAVQPLASPSLDLATSAVRGTQHVPATSRSFMQYRKTAARQSASVMSDLSPPIKFASFDVRNLLMPSTILTLRSQLSHAMRCRGNSFCLPLVPKIICQSLQ